jgi:hypothetical protein
VKATVSRNGAANTDCCESVTLGRETHRLTRPTQLTRQTSGNQPRRSHGRPRPSPVLAIGAGVGCDLGWDLAANCPVIAGCAAAPDSPPRVLAPEPLKFGILVVPAWPGVHGGRREVAGRPRCCGRRAGAWMAAGAMQLPPSRWDLRRRRARSPAPESGGPARAARPGIPLTTWAVGYGADRHSGRSGSLIACPRSGHCADAFG